MFKGKIKDLTLKQRAFALEYMKDFNATQAAIRAGYSKKTARSIAAENLTKPNIQFFLTEQKQKAVEKAEISIEWVIKELKEIYRRCTEGRLEGKTAVRSLELMGKYLGMWIEKHQIINDDLHITVDFINQKK